MFFIQMIYNPSVFFDILTLQVKASSDTWVKPNWRWPLTSIGQQEHFGRLSTIYLIFSISRVTIQLPAHRTFALSWNYCKNWEITVSNTFNIPRTCYVWVLRWKLGRHILMIFWTRFNKYGLSLSIVVAGISQYSPYALANAALAHRYNSPFNSS